MSISSQSWESIINVVNQFYDKNLKLHYTPEHLQLTFNILGMFVTERNFSVACTDVILREPIIFYGNTTYLSVPLIAKLVNKVVDLPPNRVEFVENVDLFDGLQSLVQEDLSHKPHCKNKCFEDQFNHEETVRYTQILRIVVMCSHFLQHRIHNIPFDNHKDFRDIEIAKMPNSSDVVEVPTQRKINYYKMQNA